MRRLVTLIVCALLFHACARETPSIGQTPPGYLDYTGRDDVLSGGVKMIPVETPRGVFRVWTKRIGNNPKIKVLPLFCANGSHLAMYDDQKVYMDGVIQFVRDVDAGRM
jgi:proline iminopeptidase